MKFLLGTWYCKSTRTAAGRGAGRAETDVTTLTLDDYYMLTRSTSEPFDKARTTTLVGRRWVGWDGAKKLWYATLISNFGGLGVSTSPGWKGNTITWTDIYGTGGHPLGKTLVTKVSDTKTTSTSTNGSQTTSDECTKSSVSLGSVQSSAPVPNPKPDWSSMRFLLGTWNCKAIKNLNGRGSERTETQVTTLILGDHYLQTKVISPAYDALRPKPLVTERLVGWDGAKKQWYYLRMTSYGFFGLSVSPGWVGNKIKWTFLYSSHGRMPAEAIVTKLSPTEMTSSFIVQGRPLSSDCVKVN